MELRLDRALDSVPAVDKRRNTFFHASPAQWALEVCAQRDEGRGECVWPTVDDDIGTCQCPCACERLLSVEVAFSARGGKVWDRRRE